ncbi:uncharacterized protein LOC117474148 [Trematomus bernacchii]|uniref:uncharacterized protein LOC117474148 n=1 Tax=Trematomus bernacchii TaxID=40690 RepID=UPI00146A7042|nr:uncharacterized protein LOC117474148 [Trematomus bernacchii]
MEPLLEHRSCPSCPGLIAGADPHRQCFQCLGQDHAEQGAGQTPACVSCCSIPMLNRRHRAEYFSRKFGPQVHGEEEDVDLEVVEMDDLEDVPFEFVLPRDRVVDFTEDDDISLSDTPGSDSQEGPALRSARLDFPAVMTQAAERVGLPLPPPLPPRVQGRSDTVCAGVPPLDESLAAHLLPRSAGWAEGKKPLPPLPRDREALEYLDKIFRLGVTASSAGGGAQCNGETEGETPVRKSRAGSTLRFFNQPRGASVPALTGAGCPATAVSAAAENRRVGSSAKTQLTGGGRKRLIGSLHPGR